MAVLWVAVVVSTVALIQNARTLHQFYLDTASLSPGTGVRPMGVTFALGVTWTASVLFGGGCALIGGVVSLLQRHRLMIVLSVLAGIFSFVPLIFSHHGFMHVIELRKLVLEP